LCGLPALLSRGLPALLSRGLPALLSHIVTVLHNEER
jgi:hypothetical protein